ncbi:hypothetical protein ACXR0O_10090 [Verrucomicrobiota bacterium sgz303538]
MLEKRIRDLFDVSPRFLRSAHLERDFKDSTALSGYVLTDFSRSCLGRIANGFKPESGQRAWRVTGDYGSGKSSFALLFARWAAGDESQFPPHLRKRVEFQQFGVPRPNFVPVLVTCSRQALSLSILSALSRTLSELYRQGPKPKFLTEVQQLLESGKEPTDERLIQLILEVNFRVIESKGKGLLLILDELGKFLEFAALHPQRQDVFLLQELAEAASRSGDEPFFVVCLLHQGFNAYADQLNQSAQREWEKIAGRFEEIVFNQPIEQITAVIASALNVRTQDLPRAHADELRRAMEEALASGWFGPAPAKSLVDSAAHLFPLHPTVLPVLIRTFRRFGQNERSLFSFLLSNEPFGLMAFAEQHLKGGELYRLHNFYDYVRTNFGHKLAVQSYRSHWNLIDSVVESFATEDEMVIKVLKTVGILNLLDDGDLAPREDAVLLAIGGNDSGEQKQIRTAINSLLKSSRRALYDRGRARGLCLWPHTSVDLEKAYEDARRALGAPQRVANLIKGSLETRPIVARRHYIKTGNLRHAEVRYSSVAELPSAIQKENVDSDGVILVPLCETVEERQEALTFAIDPELSKRSHWLLAVPQPLSNLASLVQEFQRWEWISTNVLELNADKYAREEVSRQKAAAQAQLQRRIQSYIGLKQLSGRTQLEWFHRGRPVEIPGGRELLEKLSHIFDKTYALAPRIHNELVNRRSISSAAAAARMRLIERMLKAQNSDLLGMDSTKRPPEMSMYFSVLKNTGLHHQQGDSWRIGEPDQQLDARCRVLPTLHRIHELVTAQPDTRVSISTLFAELRNPPFGVRDGLIPLLLTVFAIANEKDIALYKDGTFLRELDAETMLVLTKAPERFDIQYCKVEGLRAEVFDRLLSILEVIPTEGRNAELLDVVKALCVFVAQLPSYVLNTKKLSATALAVRDTILNAREPARLLFIDLPKACSYDSIAPESSLQTKEAQAFTKTLKSALDELRAAFPEMQERLRVRLRAEFDSNGTFQQFRTSLATRAERVLVGVAEPKLRAFCLRLLDDNLREVDWLESLGSYLALKPPAKWHDAEEELFNNELTSLATRFRRVESIVFGGDSADSKSKGVRLAVTQSNGVEHEQVLHYSPAEENRMLEIQRQFEALLAKEGRLGLAAASKAIWTNLEKLNANE